MVVRQVMIFLHVFAMAVWVGGMFFAHLCLRPAASSVLELPQRMPLWLGTLRLFFKYLIGTVAVVLVSGYAMFFVIGPAGVPPGIHIMSATGLLMALIFAYTYFVPFSKLRKHCRDSAWTEAAAAQASIRRMVGVNLILGIITIAAAASAA